MLSAAGDQLTITQPRGDTTISTALIAIGGPALFLAGMTAVHRLVLAERRPELLAGIALLLPGIPLAFVAPPLVAGLYSTAVLIVAAARGSRALSLPRAARA
jgi:low temperature requirement protein LtrA